MQYDEWSRRIKLLFVLAVMILIIPHAVRILSGNDTFIGKDAYFDIKTANEIINGERGIYEADSYQILIMLMIKFLRTDALLRLVPLVLGIISLYLSRKILREMRLKKRASFFIMLSFILSPFFVSTFTISSKKALAVALFLVLIYSFFTRKSIVATASAILLALSGFWSALYTALIWVIQVKNKRISFKKSAIALVFIALAIIFLYIPEFLAGNIQFEHPNYLREFLSDFGGINGIGIFSLLLAVVGLFTVRKFKRKNYLFYISSALLIIASFFFNELIAYTQLIIIFLAGLGYSYFYKIKWEADYLRQAFLLLLFCGLLFSTISDAINVSHMLPSQKYEEAMGMIKNYSQPGDIIFSDYRNGFWMEYFADRKAVLNEKTKNNADEKFSDSHALLNTYDLKEAKKIISKYGVKFIVITKNMFEGDVWEREDRGLHFLMQNKENFEKEYNNSEVHVWRYVGEAKE